MNLEWYHQKGESKPIFLTEQEERDRSEDWEDIKNQREYRDARMKEWQWAGSVYNVIQNSSPSDEISNITLGWIRSYCDTGISQMTNGEPDFTFKAYGPYDYGKEKLWSKMAEAMLSASYYNYHQKTAITDAFVFGTGAFEVYQGVQYRTLRIPKEDGTFTEKIVVDSRRPKCGVRAVSPFRVTRNPHTTEPNEIGSCSKEELLGWNEFVVKYGRCIDDKGKLKYKNIDQIPKGSHVKVTKYQDENRDVYRIYALSYGNQNDGKATTPPNKLGIPIFDRPLKIHDIKDKRGEILRSLGLNIPGACNLVFLPYLDRLDDDFQTHAVYGAGLPKHMEGLDTFVQTAFNMTIDNFRLGNTVVIGVNSRDGTVPDFDANTYYGGEFVNADITSTSLGQDRTANFSQMYDQIQNLAIPGTGININQIAGDTSKTAFEFAQRIKANSERAETILRSWENGPFKRLGTLALSAALSEMTTYDLEQLSGDQAEEVLKQIKAGKQTRDDYEFEGGKPTARRNRQYITMQGLREDFSNGKSRLYSSESTDNTLVNDDSGRENRIPMTREYVYPSHMIESGVPYDVTVDSKRMLVNKKIQDTQTMQLLLNAALQGIQFDEKFRSSFDFSKFFNSMMERSDFDADAFMKKMGDEQIAKLRNKLDQFDPLSQQQNAQTLSSPAVSSVASANPLESAALAAGQGGANGAYTRAAEGTL